MRVRWFRCYSDIKDDPKALSLTDHEFRLWIHLLALASEEGEQGKLPSFSERGIVATLRTNTPKWRSALATFSALHMVSGCPEEGLTIINWRKRQYASDDPTQRSRKHRATLQERSMQQPRNAPEDRVQKQSTDPDPEETTTTRDAAGWYRMLNHRTPNAVTKEMLLNLDVAHPVECLAWAFQLSAEKDDPWRYGKSVLDSCLVEGHGPRVKESHRGGNGQGRGAVRQGDGRRIGASQRVAGAGVDWDAEQREHERLIAGAQGGTAGAA